MTKTLDKVNLRIETDTVKVLSKDRKPIDGLLGDIPIGVALEHAHKHGLDLIPISVCRHKSDNSKDVTICILHNVGKFRFEEAKKRQKKRKIDSGLRPQKTTQCTIRALIQDNDLKHKLSSGIKHLQQGIPFKLTFRVNKRFPASLFVPLEEKIRSELSPYASSFNKRESVNPETKRGSIVINVSAKKTKPAK